MNQPITIGLLGAVSNSYLIRLFQNKQFKIIGNYATSIVDKNNIEGIDIKWFTSLEEMLSVCDAFYIGHQYPIEDSVLYALVRQGKHLFFEKIPNLDSQELEYIEQIAKEANTTVYISIPDKFNPTYQKLLQDVDEPFWVELIRNITHASYKISLNSLYEYLIKDITLLLHLTKGNIKKFRVKNLYNNTHNIIVVVDFDNGTSALVGITAISKTKSNTIKVIQGNSILHADFNKRVLKKDEVHATHHKVEEQQRLFDDIDIINEELNHFADILLHSHADNINWLDVIKATSLVEPILKTAIVL